MNHLSSIGIVFIEAISPLEFFLFIIFGVWGGINLLDYLNMRRDIEKSKVKMRNVIICLAIMVILILLPSTTTIYKIMGNR